MKSREEWNERLQEDITYYEKNKLYHAEKLNEAYDYFSLCSANDWIPVEYGLPMYGKEVLVYTENKEIKKATLGAYVRGDIKIADSWNIKDFCSSHKYKVVAWMQIPKYEEEV